MTNRWLPADLFPFLTHPIAAAAGPYQCHKFSFPYPKGYILQSPGLPVQTVIGVTDIFQFNHILHDEVTSYGISIIL